MASPKTITVGYSSNCHYMINNEMDKYCIASTNYTRDKTFVVILTCWHLRKSFAEVTIAL